MRKREQVRRVIFCSVIVILALVIALSAIMLLTDAFKEQEPQVTPSSAIERNGIKYFPRQDLVTMLVMGIDEEGPVKDSGSYENEGFADMLALVVFDETNKTMDIIQINRDTMVEMPVLGLGGKVAGTAVHQIAKSHTYGNGLKESCENTQKTVSDLFNGFNVKYYVSMNMDAIPLLNHAVGGVTVNVTEDFSNVNPNITLGECLLGDQEALDYVQARRDVDDQLNTSRMDRQEKYMRAFLSKFKSMTKSDDGFILSTYDAVSPYLVTNFQVGSLSNEMNKYSDYQLGRVISLPGSLVLGQEGLYEYHLDEQALEDLVLEIFYEPSQS